MTYAIRNNEAEEEDDKLSQSSRCNGALYTHCPSEPPETRDAVLRNGETAEPPSRRAWEHRRHLCGERRGVGVPGSEALSTHTN